MKGYIRKSFVFLVLLLALFGILASLTRATEVLTEINLYYFALASFFFIFGILLWIISWAYLIKKHASISYSKLIGVGFASLYGALTPIQLGAEALRSISLKQFFKVSYSDSVSASMIVKGIKFLILAILACIIILLFLVDTKMDAVLFFAFFSGFSVVILASFLFLAPIGGSGGKALSFIFKYLSRFFSPFSKLADFFIGYSAYLKNIKKRTFLLVFSFAFFSWIFEFLALQFSFYALNISLMIHSLLIFMIIVSILERTPLLPRGIGLVEFVGYHFLAFPHLIAGATLTTSQIGAVLIVYDIIRLVVPTVISIVISFFFLNYIKEHK